jgi:hypothetical protein
MKPSVSVLLVSMSLCNLATAILSRYKQSGNTENLEKGITYHLEALSLCPPGHPDPSTTLPPDQEYQQDCKASKFSICFVGKYICPSKGQRVSKCNFVRDCRSKLAGILKPINHDSSKPANATPRYLNHILK